MSVAGYGLGNRFGSSQPPSAGVIAIALGMRPTLIGLSGVLVAVATDVTVVLLTVALTTEAVFPSGLPGPVAVSSVCEKRAAPRMLAAARWTLGEMATGLRQTGGRWARYICVESDSGAQAAPVTGHRLGDEPGESGESCALDAAHVVTALYEGHALALIRLAYIMLGDRHAAEDVVQDAFCALYRAWPRLPNRVNLLGYVRASVVNGCRSVHRRARRVPRPLAELDAASAESEALAGEEQRATAAALLQLPPRQREAIVLRFYADLPEQEVAQVMGVSRGTVKSTTARGLAALGRILREEQ